MDTQVQESTHLYVALINLLCVKVESKLQRGPRETGKRMVVSPIALSSWAMGVIMDMQNVKQARKIFKIEC